MPKNITLMFGILIILNCCFVYFENINAEEPNSIYVDSARYLYRDGTAENPLESIQEAIDEAEEGDNIYIFSGIYKENIIINKKLKIVGSIDDIETIIDAKHEKRYNVEITADYVTIEGITLSDSDNSITSPIGSLISIRSNNNIIQGNFLNNSKSWAIYLDSKSEGNVISHNKINNTKKGIYAYDSDTNDILNNIFSNCSEDAIRIFSSQDNRIYGNWLDNSSNGIYAENCDNINITNNTVNTSDYYGIYLEQCNKGKINYNKLYNNSNFGIYVESYDCNIFENELNGNGRAITIGKSDCIFLGNNISNSSASGIYANFGSKDNIIYKNRFIENGKSAQDDGDNQWYYEEQGNYWDDYDYIDRDLDGIGDNYYDKEGIKDKYPLGFFLNPPIKPENPKPEDSESNVGLKITLQVEVEDEDSDVLKVFFYKASLDGDTLLGVDNKVNEGEKAEFSFTQAFNTTFAWYAIANDSILENKSDTWFFTTKATPPENTPPVANAGGPYEVDDVGDTIIFDASDSYDSDGDIIFYRWNFGDGTSEILAKKPLHNYSVAGVYEVILTVIDNNGSSDTEIVFVKVETDVNLKPKSVTGGPYNGTVNKVVIFDGSGSYDPDGTLTNYSWNFGDGQTSFGSAVTHVYKNSGSYVVYLTVVDDSDGTDTQSTIINIVKNQDTPGFEIILSFLSLILIIGIIRKYNCLKF